MPFLLLRNDESKSPFDVVAFLPDNIESLQKPPLIVFLHGSGERGSNPEQPTKGVAAIFEQMQLPAVVIFPQCDAVHRAFYGAMEDRVLQSIDKAIQEYGADPKRIYFVGYSMGGSSILWLAARHPKKFAGALSIAPGITWMGEELPPKLPTDVTRLFNSMFVADNRTERIAKEIRDFPVWFLQGTEDEPCPIDETRQVVAEMRQLGAEPKLTEYEGMGHDSLSSALAEEGVFDWLLGLAT
jgi:predicted peptidase